VKKTAAGRRKPAAGSRKPAAGRRKPAAGSRKPAAGRRKPAAGSGKRAAGSRKPAAGSRKLTRVADAKQIQAIRRQIESLAAARPPRWNADPEDVRRSVLKLVLTLVELIRQLLERQAIRRMEAGTLSEDETESVGLALMRLQETILDLAKQFDIPPDELNLDLGPVGRLM
jgi:hypothetical protein